MSTPSDEKTSKRPVIAAATAAVCLLVAGGVGHRLLSRQLDMAVGKTRIPAGTLARLPLKLGDWTGKDVPLKPAVIRRTDTDDLINRVYLRGGVESVGLFVGAGIRARDLSPHRPEVCYPGAGWTLLETNDVTVPLEDGSDLSCRILRFSRTGLMAKTITVLNYYIVNGQYCPDVSLLRSKIWRGSKGIRYVAQVQVNAAGSQFLSAEESDRAVRAFGARSAKGILALLSEVDQSRNAGAP